MYEVIVKGWFAAAHQLRLPDGRMEPLHGHNWMVQVTYRGPELDAMGVLVDFTVVKPQLDRLLAEMHDRNLNDLPQFGDRNPSAENVARHIAEQMTKHCPQGVTVASVDVEEAPGCVARWRG